MSAIDYGALLRIDGKFINKNGDLFMDMADAVGCEIEKVCDLKGREYSISGDWYVYAGEYDLYLCFYKGYFIVVKNNVVVFTYIGSPHIAETFKISGIPEISVRHLDPELRKTIKKGKSWTEYVKDTYIGATGKETLSELQNGQYIYKKFLRRAKQIGRKNRSGSYGKDRSYRYLASWEYNGRKYEVIFGYGIDPNEAVWNNIKNTSYGHFSETEKKIIDKWFSE